MTLYYIKHKMSEIIERLKQNMQEGLKLIAQLEEYYEIWKPIENYNNYAVSSWGNVKNVNTGKILKPCLRSGYLYVNFSGTKKYIHRLVAENFINNTESKSCIDHIDRNKTNNRLHNLRWVTHMENMHNVGIKNSNTSGYIGISWNKEKKKWQAYITHNYKQLNLGYFRFLEEAIKSRQEKTDELFGEYANKNKA